LKSVDESVEQLADYMLQFCQKSRRQRINQRNRTERLSDLLDWKVLGMEYVRARKLSLHRVYPDSFGSSNSGGFNQQKIKIPKPPSAPASPKIRGGSISVDDLTSNMQQLGYDEEEEYPFPPFPLILKRSSSERDLLS
jgi:glycogen(starch) synthase